MFGAQYFGQAPFATSEGTAVPIRPAGGGGWTHRAPVTLPERKTPEFKPPKFQKPKPYSW